MFKKMTFNNDRKLNHNMHNQDLVKSIVYLNDSVFCFIQEDLFDNYLWLLHYSSSKKRSETKSYDVDFIS